MWIINDVYNVLIYIIKFINIRKFIYKKMKLRKYKIYLIFKFNYLIMYYFGDFFFYYYVLSEYFLLLMF